MITADSLRLQVYISRSGYCSRRKAMDLIQQGAVSVNGQCVREPSTSVSDKDRVTIEGQEIGLKTFVYYLVNKPTGYTTTKKDPFAEKTVMDLVPATLRHLFPVGRLDKNSSGLILLTNDGPLAERLLHPRFHVAKTYEVCVAGRLEAAARSQLEKGVMIEGGKTQPAVVKDVSIARESTKFRLIIREGRKRQIRLMLEALGYAVITLKRVAFGPLSLGTLEEGRYRQLTKEEVEKLKKVAGAGAAP